MTSFQPIIELAIGGVEQVGEKRFLLCRLCEGTLRVGDELNIAYISTLQRTSGDVNRHDFRPVALRVVSIEAYGFSLKEISLGMTARVGVVGDDADTIVTGETIAFTRNSLESLA